MIQPFCRCLDMRARRARHEGQSDRVRPAARCPRGSWRCGPATLSTRSRTWPAVFGTAARDKERPAGTCLTIRRRPRGLGLRQRGCCVAVRHCGGNRPEPSPGPGRSSLSSHSPTRRTRSQSPRTSTRPKQSSRAEWARAAWARQRRSGQDRRGQMQRFVQRSNPQYAFSARFLHLVRLLPGELRGSQNAGTSFFACFCDSPFAHSGPFGAILLCSAFGGDFDARGVRRNYPP